MGEVQLDLLEGSFDEERRVCMNDRLEALQRHPGTDTGHQLLADTDVDDPVGVAAHGARLAELADADVGQQQGDTRILVQ
jgi:hypothetical protein